MVINEASSISCEITIVVAMRKFTSHMEIMVVVGRGLIIFILERGGEVIKRGQNRGNNGMQAVNKKV